MAKISRELAVTNLHPRETLWATASLASINADLFIDCDSAGCIALDVRGTFTGVIEVAGTVNGTDWTLIALRPIAQVNKSYAMNVNGVGLWAAPLLAPFRRIRARMTTFSGGAAITTLSAANSMQDQSMDGMVTSGVVTSAAAAAAALTLTIPSPSGGMRQYLTYISISRFASTMLIAAAAPVIVTTTNLPGSLSFGFPADAAPLGTMDRWREDFSFPVAASNLNTNTTIVCPATPGVIWRATAGYYFAP